MNKGRSKEYKVLVYDKLPYGCSILNGATTAPKGYKWAHNCKGFSKESRYFLVKYE